MTGRARGRPAADDPNTLPTDLLLDRALEMFAEHGYDGMSVRELARDLGVSHNLIPQRIGSKERLWFEAVDRGFGALAVALAEAINDQATEADDVVKLRALIVRFIEANAARPALLRVINQEATSPGPRLEHLFTQYIEPVRQFGADLLARLEADGRVRTSKVSLLYFLMTHGAGGPFTLPGLAEHFDEGFDHRDPVAVRAHAEEVATIIFDGLLRPAT
ncbi:MAG: TetR/AcrR family transcriptional regulator [Acidimicrobiales bacterium]|nr:TetR/AcrR family transcriptional regulator [Acidimicrobiales bacterium]